MPIEIRRIEYTDIELRNALAFFHARKEGSAAEQVNISAVKVMGGDDFSIVAKVSTATNDSVSRKVFDHATSLAVMVLYSKKAGIPLPRNAPKVLAPNSYGGIAMTLRYEHDIPALQQQEASA